MKICSHNELKQKQYWTPITNRLNKQTVDTVLEIEGEYDPNCMEKEEYIGETQRKQTGV